MDSQSVSLQAAREALVAGSLDAQGLRQALEGRESLGTLCGGLEALAAWDGRYPGALPSLEELADPEGALMALDALGAAQEGEDPPQAQLLGRLMRLGSQSRHFGRMVGRQSWMRPALLGDLGRSRLEEGQRRRALALEAQEEPEARWAALRRWRMVELVRAFYREATGLAPVTVTTAEVSALASACLEAALRWSRQELAQKGDAVDAHGEPIPFVIMGLGKLGGWELNFSSDVDIVYVYGSDEGQVQGAPSQQWAVHDFFKRLARLLTARVEELTPQGRLWRVDLRLRPGGARGPLVHAVDAVESYYEAWGSAFERLAWLKARPVAGDQALGRALMQRLTPFVYPRTVDWEALEALRGLKGKIDGHASRRRTDNERLRLSAAHGAPPSPQVAALPGWDVKLGQGGIREVEFVVQALQLVCGGRQPQLRGPSTLPALERLLTEGLLPAAEVDQLARAYTWLRLVEHRVQMEGERQTHALPGKLDELARLAARMGHSLESFAQHVAQLRGQVQAIFGRLLGQGDGQGPQAPSLPEALRRVLELEALDPDLEEVQEVFAQAGFARPRQAAGHLLVLRARPYGPFSPSASASMEALGGAMLREVVQAADPDLALVHLTGLLVGLGPRGQWLQVLHGSPALLTALVSLLGSSRYLSQLLVRHPGLMDSLLGEAGWMTPAGLAQDRATYGGRAWLERELALEVEGLPSQEARLEGLRRFRHRRELRVALSDSAGLLDLRGVGEALSELAEVCVSFVVSEARRELEARHGQPRAGDGAFARFCVLGLGKLGSRELVYGSDLDLVFLHDGVGQTDGERPLASASFFGRLGRRVISFLSTSLTHGRLYAIDTRLRPSGSRGTLVVTLEGFASYHRREAALWERQSLLRARPVAGAPQLGARAMEVCREQVYGQAPGAQQAAQICADIHQMRLRVRADLASRGGRGYNVKLDEGGIMDVEFVVQALQLLHGAKRPQLQRVSTWDVLEAIGELGLLPMDSARALREGYAVLRRLECRLRVLEGQGESLIPMDDPRALTLLARRAGYRGVEPGAALGRELAQVSQAVARVYQEVVAQAGAAQGA